MGNYRQGVFALIIDQSDNLLIIQKVNYNDNDWTVIGGGREEGETPEQNLFREVLEETAIDSDGFELIGLGSNKHKYEFPGNVGQTIHNGQYIGQEYDLFVLKLKTDKQNLKFAPEEIKTHKWVPIESLHDYLHFTNQFENFSKALNEIVNKEQD